MCREREVVGDGMWRILPTDEMEVVIRAIEGFGETTDTGVA